LPIGFLMEARLFADQIASAIPRAQFHELQALAETLWKAFYAGHLDEAQAQELAEQIEARKPKGRIGVAGFAPVRAPEAKPQRSPDRQASIARRRRLARASPVPPELVDKFSQAQHAVMTVVCGEIQRVGLCAWFIDKIAAVAGCGRTTVQNTLRVAREEGLLFRNERRRRGQKSLSNIVRALRQSWGRWLRRIGSKKFDTTSDIDPRKGNAGGVERSGEASRQTRTERRGIKQTE
jgi:hypothetical protein